MIDSVSEIDIDCSLFLSVSWSDGIIVIVTESLVVEWPLIPIVNASGVCAYHRDGVHAPRCLNMFPALP